MIVTCLFFNEQSQRLHVETVKMEKNQHVESVGVEKDHHKESMALERLHNLQQLEIGIKQHIESLQADMSFAGKLLDFFPSKTRGKGEM